LPDWVKRFGSGAPTAADVPEVGRGESAVVRMARLEAELRTERAERRKWETERNILRSAAKYFAGETRW
jgi:transposase